MIERTEEEIMSTWKVINEHVPLITIEMLTYNHDDYVEMAIDGILSQVTEYPFQLFIHDDASTDGTAEIIKQYITKYPHIIMAILEAENQYSKGNGEIEKILQMHQEGDYLAFCEGDDYWIDKEKIQKQVDFLIQHPEYSAVYSNILPVDENSKHDETKRGIYPVLDDGDYTIDELSKGVFKTQTATLVCRNIYKNMNNEDLEKIRCCKANGDRKMLIVLSSYGKVHYLSDVTAAHRKVFDSGDSWTAQMKRKTRAQRYFIKFNQLIEMAQLYEYFHHKRMDIWNRIYMMQIKSQVRYIRESNRIEKDIYHQIIMNKDVRKHINLIRFLGYAVKKIKKKTT